MLRIAALLSALVVATPGRAEEQRPPGWPDVVKKDCTCPAFGKDFLLGDTVCLRTPEGMRVAQCVMVLNNTSWSFTDEDCPRS